jgi:hypothetical protein
MGMKDWQPLNLTQLINDVDELIPGHLNTVESLMLCTLVTQLEENAKVVHLNPLVGQASALMAAGLLAGKGGRLFAIGEFDLAQGATDWGLGATLADANQRDQFNQYVAGNGLGHYVTTRVENATQAASRFKDRCVDLLFVDANRTISELSAELEGWLPKVKVGGVVACHGATPEAAEHLQKALSDTLLSPRLVCAPVLTDGLFVCRRHKAPKTKPKTAPLELRTSFGP